MTNERKKTPLTITSFSKDAEQPKLSHVVGKRQNATTDLENNLVDSYKVTS